MKLGICYMIFDGEELLEFAVKSVRSVVDYISVTYQTTSYFGNQSNSNIKEILYQLKDSGLVDEIVHCKPDLSLHPKINELNLRNLGLDLSKRVGCTHHISADVDEFYDESQLKYAKKIMKGNYDFSIVEFENYYKDPAFLVTPSQGLIVTFIHPVDNCYCRAAYEDFPFKVEETRRMSINGKFKRFSKEEIVMHHMSYIRRDIRKKFDNSYNKNFCQVDKFISDFENHQVGDRVRLIPDFINRNTVLVGNKFQIKI